MIKALILFLLISLGLYFYFYEDEQKMAVKEIFPVNLADKYNFQTKRINGKEISVSIAEDDTSFNGDVTKFSNRTTPITHEVKTIQIPEDYNVQDANSEAFLLMTNFKSTVADLIVGDKVLIDVQDNKTLELNIGKLEMKIGNKVVKSFTGEDIGNSTIVAGNFLITGSVFSDGNFYTVSSANNGNSVITNMTLSGIDYGPPEGTFDNDHPPHIHNH